MCRHSIHTPVHPSSRIVLWLPSGLPQLVTNRDESPTHEDFCPISLAKTVSATVIQINYRLSRDHCYPTPVHDVLAGYDWVVKNVVPKLTHFSTYRYGKRGFNNNNNVRLHVCGELVGGSLASMLALTECRIGETGVNAALINNPITDWINLQEPSPQSHRSAGGYRGKTIPPDINQPQRIKSGRPEVPSPKPFAPNAYLRSSCISAARSTLFKDFSSYSDPFASPFFFFRTTGAIPPSLDDSGAIPPLPQEENGTSSPMTSDGGEPQVIAVPRKAYLKYPPSSAALRLPPFRIELGAQFPLRDQIEEFASVLKRSHRLHGSGRGRSKRSEDTPGKIESAGNIDEMKQDWDESMSSLQAHPTAQDAELARMVQLSVKDGVGLWDRYTEEQKIETVVEIGHWLKDVSPEAP
ncbi:MAG: hypothetical protein M1822_008758 [Bathelium mastoideum]|nr:MAG: hypothetical protein M1822_008758 [Bathelium mastoideum]